MSGIAEAGWRTFGLLIVTEHFEASSTAKAIVPAAFMVGLLFTPISTFYLSRLPLSASRLCSANYLLASGLLALASFGRDSLLLFLLPGVCATALIAQQMPLLVHIYSSNYLPTQRGKRVAVGLTLSVCTALPFGYFGGLLLDQDLSQFPWVFRFMALAVAISAMAMWFVPSNQLQASQGANPLRNLSIAWTDKVFGCLLVMWMIMGFGNLATLPLQIEYMRGEAFGINASVRDVTMVMIIIPSFVRMLATPVWGHLFDVFNFFSVRAMVSLIMLAAILVFYNAPNIGVVYLGAFFYGLSLAGANINWSLWVTKFAPPGRESDYMSVHAFMTGVRGVAAPFFGFYMLNLFSLRQTIAFGSVLVALSIVMLWPISRMARR